MRMRSVAPIKAAKIGYILISILLCLLGILLITNPDLSISLIGKILAAIMIIFGIIKLIGYFSKDLYRLAFQYDLAFGILFIALGLIMLVYPRRIIGFICIALGIFIFADGLFKIQIALDCKRFGIRQWWLILIFALIASIFGLVLIFFPEKSSIVLTTLLGACLFFEGILNFSTVIMAVKIIGHQYQDAAINEQDENREA